MCGGSSFTSYPTRCGWPRYNLLSLAGPAMWGRFPAGTRAPCSVFMPTAEPPHHVVRKEANCEETRPTARAPRESCGRAPSGAAEVVTRSSGKRLGAWPFPIEARSAPGLAELARHFLVYSQAPRRNPALSGVGRRRALAERPRLPSFPRCGIVSLFLAWSEKECTRRQEKGAKDRFQRSPRSEKRRPLTPPWTEATARPWQITPPTISLRPR